MHGKNFGLCLVVHCHMVAVFNADGVQGDAAHSSVTIKVQHRLDLQIR